MTVVLNKCKTPLEETVYDPEITIQPPINLLTIFNPSSGKLLLQSRYTDLKLFENTLRQLIELVKVIENIVPSQSKQLV